MMFFIQKEEVPQDRFQDVTNRKFVVDYRENKEEKECVRLTGEGIESTMRWQHQQLIYSPEVTFEQQD